MIVQRVVAKGKRPSTTPLAGQGARVPRFHL
jgi:hypothetical protein